VSEPQGAEKKEEKPNLEPFLGLIEHISRSMDTAERATADLPDQILSLMESPTYRLSERLTSATRSED
jgi:hypothetical protein